MRIDEMAFIGLNGREMSAFRVAAASRTAAAPKSASKTDGGGAGGQTIGKLADTMSPLYGGWTYPAIAWYFSRMLIHRDAAIDKAKTAVERVFSQHNVRTVMGTAQAAGIAVLCAARRGLPVALHTPSEVKAAITGSGTADKKQIGAMVTRLLRLDGPPKPADAAPNPPPACRNFRRASRNFRRASRKFRQGTAL